MKNAAFDQNLRRASWRYNARMFLPSLLIVLGVAGLVYGVSALRRAEDRNMAGAPLRQSVGVVTDVRRRPGTDEHDPQPTFTMTLRLPDVPAPVGISRDVPFPVGVRVRAAYRVGKNGRVYVGHVERLTAANGNEQGELSR